MNVKCNRKISILNNPIILFFLILSFFKPPCLEHLAPIFDQIFDICAIFSFIFILGLYVYNHNISKIIFAIITYEFALFISTVINNGDYWVLAVTCGKIIAICMLVELCIKVNVNKFISMVTFILSILCTVNFITILLFPNGMYISLYWQNWFLGYDNGHSLYILPLLFFLTVILTIRKYPTLFIFLLLLFFSASIYITWAVSGVVAMSVFLLLFLVQNLHLKILNLNFYFFCNVVAFFVIIIFRVQDVFSFFIVNILKKDVTFTGRTYIWDKALYWLAQNPIFGGGVMNSFVNSKKLGGYFHCHNAYLNILYQSGLFGMAAFIVVMLLIIKTLNDTKNNKISFFVSNTLFCYLIMFQVEAMENSITFFLIITIAYHIKDVITDSEKNNLKRRLINYRKYKEKETSLT